MRMLTRAAALPLMALSLSGCAGLGLNQMLQAPSFSVDSGQQAQLRILGPGPGRPVGGAAVRLFARVGNPNPIGFTLSRLVGNLQLEGRQAADVSFPLGVPLAAGQETVIPLDISINFSDIPGLADVASRALTGRAINYSLNGTVAVDAGMLGQPSFGPMTLLSGEMRAIR